MRTRFPQSIAILLIGAGLGALTCFLFTRSEGLLQSSGDRRTVPSSRAPAAGLELSGSARENANGFATVNSGSSALVADYSSLLGVEPGQVNSKLLSRLKSVMRKSDESRRKLQFSLLLEAMRAEDAPGIVSLFKELRSEGLVFSSEEMDFFAERWGELDPVAALKHYGSGEALENDEKMLEKVFSGWAAKDPASAVKTAMLQEDQQREEAVFGTVKGWARQDATEATSFVLELPTSHLRARAGETIFWQILYGQGMEAAAAWYDQLPVTEGQDIRQIVWPAISTRQRMRGDPESAAWMEQHQPPP